MSYAYNSLLSPFYTTSGIAERVYLAPVRWFANNGIAIPQEPFTVPGDRVRILTDHAFAEEEYGFVQMQLAPEKNAYDAKTIGGPETQKFEHTLNVFFAGSYAQLHETLMYMLNEPFIGLVRDSNCQGKMYYQLGNRTTHLWLQGDWASGTSADGNKGYTCTFRWVGHSLLIYQGTPTALPEDPNFDPANFLFTDFKTI